MELRDSEDFSERRHHTRYPVTFSVRVQSEEVQERLHGALVDVSDGGLLLFLSRSLPVGAQVGVQLEAPGVALRLTGRIVWGAERQGLAYVHGVAFDREKGKRFARGLYQVAHELW